MVSRMYSYRLDHIRKTMYRRKGRDTCRGCGKTLEVGDWVVRTRAESGNWLWEKACYEGRYIDLPDMEASQ